MSRRRIRSPKRHRAGAMLVLIAITIALLLMAVAFSVDVAFMQLTRTELRTSTDAAARAATEALSRLQNVDDAAQAARNMAAANPVAGDPLQLADEDIVFGHAELLSDGSFSFDVGVTPFNSIEVRGRRTADSPSGPVGLLYAGVLGPRDFSPVQTARTVNLDRDICIVVDRSGSMNQSVDGAFNPPGITDWCQGPHTTLSRWAALEIAVRAFVDALNATDQNELLGLVSYSHETNSCSRFFPTSRIDSPLEPGNYSTVIAAMDSIDIVRGRTNISAGVDDGIAVLTDPLRTRSYAKKTLVVMTDGIQNEGRSVVLAAADAAARDITVHTVTFSAAAEQDRMRNAAIAGGGNHYHAPDAVTLARIFREIALTLPVVLAE